ncbi:bifunctional folylpolyglutamate synthase/dihydrofolate synthase [Sulfurovum riftiae]|nr:bifunctional folylpolyglutamate synthase/dihydrofolate synthase [Sulfurovum riftiae]
MQNFIDFLNEKPLYYKEIDHKRVHIAYDILKSHIKRPTTIHIIGTNGKGSTGRILAYLAYKKSTRYPLPATRLSVGHYTSPHILKFNERIWLNGEDVSDEVLEAAHQKLFGILGKELSDALSYFEYTTLLAFVVFENCDLMVLEAGLGGEFDATNVCDKELSVITPIGIDHQAFLGESIEEIAATKIRSIQKKALLAPQTYPEVVEVAEKIAEDVGATLVVAQREKDRRQEGTHKGHPYELKAIANAKGWPHFLTENAGVAMQALEILHIPYDMNDLKELELFGRFYPLTENIRIDVGHNPLAAKAIVEAMDAGTVLIYNSLDDKAYEEVLRILKPKLKRVEIIKIDSQRATILEDIEKALMQVDIPFSYFEKTEADETYLVFGSFYVIEAFLKCMR